MDYTLVLADQLRTHLRSLRKARGVTQAELGAVLGVGQARVAEIEKNPTAISVDQLLKILAYLRVQLVLRDTGQPVEDRPALPMPVPRDTRVAARGVVREPAPPPYLGLGGGKKPPKGRW